MRRINQEFHLFLIQFLLTAADIEPHKEAQHHKRHQYINKVRPRRLIPRCTDRDMVDLGLGISSTVVGSHLKGIGTRLQVCERNTVTACLRLCPVFRIIQSVFVGHILRIHEVQQRKLHRKRIVQIREFEMVALHQWLCDDKTTIRQRIAVNGITTDIKACEVNSSRYRRIAT